ncbi:MAG: Plug domain-containing protein, partial [Tannerellaceae bacterium]|nr:Plug domain-containing protein [Tannerellaceae bacterium]
MRQIFLILCLLCLPALSLHGYGQDGALPYETVSVSLHDQPVRMLFDAIEGQTSFRLYYLPWETDSIRVTVDVTAARAAAVLATVFEGSPLKVSQYDRHLFIGKTPLSTRLPEGYFDREGRTGYAGGVQGAPPAPAFYGGGQAEGEERTYDLPEVLISSERMDAVRNTAGGVQRLQVGAIRKIPTAFGEVDILRALMSLPGVKAVGEASGGFNVRGGSTDQNLILFNEGTIYNPTHMFGFFSTFNSGVVRDMELYKSSVPAKYGGRISSVLDISTREGNKKKIEGSASINLLSGSLTVEGPLVKDKTSFILSGRTTY